MDNFLKQLYKGNIIFHLEDITDEMFLHGQGCEDLIKSKDDIIDPCVLQYFNFFLNFTLYDKILCFIMFIFHRGDGFFTSNAESKMFKEALKMA